MCYAGESAADCLQLMRRAELEYLLVLDRRIELVGIVAQRDLDQSGRANLLVDEFMSKRLLKCSPNEDIRTVARKMTSKQDGVAVMTENQRLVGVLTMSDLLRHAQVQWHRGKSRCTTYRIEGKRQ